MDTGWFLFRQERMIDCSALQLFFFVFAFLEKGGAIYTVAGDGTLLGGISSFDGNSAVRRGIFCCENFATDQVPSQWFAAK